MSDQMNVYLPLIIIGGLILMLILGLVFRPGQRVKLDNEAPERPHIAHSYNLTGNGEGHGLLDQSAAAVTDVAGQALQTDAHEHLPGATGTPDDLTRLKGVGPKLAKMLNAKGFVRFEQLAELSAAQVHAMSDEMGAFKGRLERDRVTEQAAFLARGDIDGYEAKFGKLG